MRINNLLKKLFYIFTILFGITILSCTKKEHIDYVYYEDGETIREMRTYPQYPNDSCFIEKTFYKNGQLFSEGVVVDFNSLGKWYYWFEDGKFMTSIFYKNGKPDFANPNRKLPEVIPLYTFSVGVKVPVKITNLYPEENLQYEGDILVEDSDNDNYNYEVTPISGDSVSFYYDILTLVNIDSVCLEQLYKQHTLPKYDNTFIYKKRKVKLATFKIYK